MWRAPVRNRVAGLSVLTCRRRFPVRSRPLKWPSEVLGLRELRVKTVSTNRSVLSLNRKFGFRQTRVEPAAQVIGGQAVDLVHFVLEAKDWPKIREGLLPLARLAETQVQEWEQAHLQKPN